VDIDAVRRAVAHAVTALPPLSYQLIEVPFGFHRPLWRENCEIDVGYHVRCGRVPHPGGRRELESVIGRIASTKVNLRYPPWELHILDGLEDGRVAAVAKIHHALADGTACHNMLLLLAAAMQPTEAAPQPPDPTPSTGELARLAVIEHVRQLRHLPGLIRRTGRALSARRQFVRSLPAGLARVNAAPPMFWNRPLTAERAYACESWPFPPVREMGKQLGMTVNEVLLGIIAGALRKIIVDAGDRPDCPLVACVPMSIDTAAERVHGNELGGLFVSVPVQVSDPLTRLREAAFASRTAKEEQRLLGMSSGQDWIGLVPPALLRWNTRRAATRTQVPRRVAINLGFSNVAGPREKLVLAGVPIAELWSTGLLHFGCGLQITVWSYVDQLNVSVLTDSAVLPDARVVALALSAAFEEAREALALAV
jgi:WS/DGAT/MGAT family acyltransferase